MKNHPLIKNWLKLEVGDLVLKWDKAHEEKGEHTIFQKFGLGISLL